MVQKRGKKILRGTLCGRKLALISLLNFAAGVCLYLFLFIFLAPKFCAAGSVFCNATEGSFVWFCACDLSHLR